MGVPCLQVWQVLTDYEALPEFVPNLALCERLPLSRDMASRMVRLRQVMLCPAPILRTSTPPEVVTPSFLVAQDMTGMLFCTG